MEKFGMNFGSGPSKKDLQETVEAQRKQLAQYQGRLKDVVRAYKSLLKEKEALEASLRVLSVSHQADAGWSRAPPPLGPAGSSPDPSDDRASVHSEDSAGTAASLASAKGDPGPEEEMRAAGTASPLRLEETSSSESGVSSGSGGGGGEPGEADRRVLQLKTQLSTVTGALATVTQEKSRMEASYQADKRKMKQELEELGRQAGEERSALESELRGAQEQLAETKARLITQQHDRAQEQSDHAVMLRELQRLLQSERAQRQEAELSLEEAREALAGKTGVADQAEGYERRAKQLAQEAESLKRALQAVQEESSRPDPQLQELQAEVAALKSHFQAQLLQEMKKTAQAEERVQAEERRVTSLEGQMSEVSELLGTYEKAKQKDQMTIQKLKDRIAQLDLENKTLAMAASGRSSLEIPTEESNLDVNILKEMEKRRQLVQAAAKHGPCLVAPEAACPPELPKGTEAGDGERASAAYCQQELKQLKEEFERYKLRAQVVLKNKSAKDGSLARELEEAQEQLVELKEKYVSLRLSCEEVEKQHRQEVDAKRQELSRLQQLHRQELEKCRVACQEKAFRVEEEMHKQRDRALAVLAEKDQELAQLRTVVLPSGLQGAKRASLGGPGPQDDGGSQGPLGAEPLESLTQALRLTAPDKPGFLLYTEQLARKGVEVATLKKEKHRLEAEAHHLRERLLEEGERHREEVAALQGHIQKNCRDQSREGANLEYLKNIFYRFLTLTDLLGRQQTLTAILTILHFSPEERQVILRHVGGSHSWWLSGKR
uniref:GRIP and coiled-coil domain-containing protein 1 n=1 Tax=Euleptes europaea TaxID=460621 RepID=UPI002541EC46|nr:GRIP and coiled-coil domain-containing protein 1 [Euleptes europaea]